MDESIVSFFSILNTLAKDFKGRLRLNTNHFFKLLHSALKWYYFDDDDTFNVNHKSEFVVAIIIINAFALKGRSFDLPLMRDWSELNR